MEEELKQNLKRRSTWVRALYMLLFAVIYSVAEIVFAAVVVIQFGFVLITGQANVRLLDFGANLSLFLYQTLQFLCFNSETLPYPFTPWPENGASRPLDLER